MGKHGGIDNLGVLPWQTWKIDDWRLCFVLKVWLFNTTPSCCLYLEYPVVESDHDEAGDVEGAQAGPDDEVRVVEGADDGVVLV